MRDHIDRLFYAKATKMTTKSNQNGLFSQSFQDLEILGATVKDISNEIFELEEQDHENCRIVSDKFAA